MFCTLHGRAWVYPHFGCSYCATDKAPRQSYTLTVVSKTKPRRTRDGGAFDGTKGRPFIGEVFVKRGLWTHAEADREIAAFEREHGAHCEFECE